MSNLVLHLTLWLLSGREQVLHVKPGYESVTVTDCKNRLVNIYSDNDRTILMANPFMVGDKGDIRFNIIHFTKSKRVQFRLVGVR